jgi:uncharacterized protein YkwD
MGSQALKILNDFRATQGLRPLQQEATLTALATSYARYMADAGFFAHDAPDGTSPQGRVQASAYPGDFAGEALSAGQASPSAAIDAWLNSPSHRAIVLNADAVDVGLGYYFKPDDRQQYRHYWVLISGYR